MKRDMKKGLLVLATALAMIATVPANAHHSFVAEFNPDDTIAFSGIVTKVDWRNPHTYFFLDVEDNAGGIANWAMELGSPNGLMRRGWTRNSLKVGDVVSIDGFRARDGSYKGNAVSVTLSDGHQLFAGTSNPYYDKDEDAE